jgi:integrase
LTDVMPKRGKLPRGRFFGRWRVYFRGVDGREKSGKAEKIIDRDLAEQMGLVLDYEGPLTKTDARKVLQKLIRESNAAPAAFNAKATFGDLAREYIQLSRPNWSENTIRTTENLIQVHLIGKLGTRAVREITFEELQQFLNGYVEINTSSSILAKLIRHLRAILDIAVDRELLKRNPARGRDRKLKAKSRKRTCSLAHTLEECASLFAALSGRDRVAVRLLTQLGLRPEELFALRRDDVRESELVIDEALVNGHTKYPKTLASASSAYLPADLLTEVKYYLERIDRSPSAWLFPSQKESKPVQPNNFLRRVLKPAAIRAGIAVTKDESGDETTALNFQSLRRTSSTLWRARQRPEVHAGPHAACRPSGHAEALPAGDSRGGEGGGDRLGGRPPRSRAHGQGKARCEDDPLEAHVISVTVLVF